MCHDNEEWCKTWSGINLNSTINKTFYTCCIEITNLQMYKLEFYRGLCVMTMKNDAKIDQKSIWIAQLTKLFTHVV